MAVTAEKAKELLGSVKMDLNGNFYSNENWYVGINEDMRDTIIIATNAIDENVKYKKLLKEIDSFEKDVLAIDSDKMSGENILNYICQLIESHLK